MVRNAPNLTQYQFVMHISYTSCSGDVNLRPLHVNTGDSQWCAGRATRYAVKIIYCASGLNYNVAKTFSLPVDRDKGVRAGPVGPFR